MKPHKIFKNNSNPMRHKLLIITELKEPKIPLRFFKMIHPPKMVEFIWEFKDENITLDQIDHQQS